MPFTPTELQVVAAAEAAKILYISLHVGDPGSTGANEASWTGYARQAVTCTSSGGTVTIPQVSFSNGSGSSVTPDHFGMWSAVTGGTFYGGDPLTGSGLTAAGGVCKFSGSIPVSST